MQIRLVQDSATRFLKDNATTVLTAGGVVGVVATGVLAFRAGVKSERIIHGHEVELMEVKQDEAGGVIGVKKHDLSTTEKAKLLAPHILPPVAVGGGTIAAIIMSHKMSANKIAVLAAAYGVSQGQLEEYKAKLEEKLGVNKYEKARAEMAQDKVNKTPGSEAVVIFGDEVLCFDECTGRYFRSSMEKINRVANATNRKIMDDGFCDASYFYSELGLPGTRWSDDVGWTQPFELEISTVIAESAGVENGKPCIVVDFKQLPVLDYVRGGDRYS